MTIPERPEDVFTPESIARIANELFAAVSAHEVDPSGTPAPPVANPGPVTAPQVDSGPVNAVQFDAVEHALQNPVTTADLASTSLAPAPSAGVFQTYNLSEVPVDSFDDGGYVSAIDALGADVLALRAPEVPQSQLAEEPEVLLDKVLQAPTDLEGVLDAAAGDHPYLQGKYETALEEAGVDDAGGGQSALQLMQELAGLAREFAGEHAVTEPGISEVSEVYAHADTSVSEDAAEEPVGSAEAEARYLQDQVEQLVTPEVAPDEGFRPTLQAADPVPALDIPPTTTGFNAERYRQDFPILGERIHGQQLVWLDNGATTQKPRQVIDRLSYFYEHENSNVHRTAHTLAGRATDAYEGARGKVRRFLNAPSSDDIVWVRGTTEGINLLANTFGEERVCEGDEVLISWLEHHANIVPWQMLCRRKGATLKVAPVDDTGQIILSEFERLITPRTKVISFTQVSNALGTITPAKEMIAIAHRHGVPVVIDGAQGVLHMPVDVQDLDCDFYVFSGHKMFAPTGIGAVYGKAEHWEKLPPWQGGGNMIDKVYFDRTTYQPPPWRFEAGTGSIADAVGLGAAIDYLDQIGMAQIEAAEHELLIYGTEQLLTVPGLHIYGCADRKAGVLSFNVRGFDPIEVGEYLDQNAIAVRAGHHCAQPILRRFGTEATVRAALALYNTREDIDRLATALHRMTSGTPAV